MALVEKRYAEALVDIAQDAMAIDAYKEQLMGFTEAYKELPELKKFLLSPEIAYTDKKALLDKLFEGQNTMLSSFLKLLLDKGRMSSISGIYEEYTKLANERSRIIQIEVTSAMPIEAHQEEKLKLKYIEEYKAYKANLTSRVDSSLIGGIIVKIGDRLIDGSIAGRLKSLRENVLK